mgnify:FL=1
MATFFELNRSALQLMEQSGTLAKNLGFEVAAGSIQGQIDAFQKKKLMVVVAGEARRGKSSLLNALLNEAQPLFPVDINVCTNVVAIVQYGEQEKIEAYIQDATWEQGYRMEAVTREQIPDYVSEQGNPSNYKNVQLLNAFIPNELLREGVVFVDTPGVGSLNIEHAETTYSFLPNADLLLFVCDADSGMTESELNFLKRSYRYCQNILYPLTKKDLNANYPAILEDNRAKISAALEIPAEDVQIVPVSSMAKQRFLKTGSKTMYANSSFAALEEQLWTTIARRRGEILISPYLSAVSAELEKILDNLTAQYRLLGSGQGAAPQLVKELNNKIEALETLQNDSAGWRSELNLFFTVLQNDVSAQQREIAAKAQTLVDKQISAMGSKICKKANYVSLLSAVNDVLSCGVLDIQENISAKITEQVLRLTEQSDFGLSVNQDILDKLDFKPDGELQVEFTKKKTSDKLVKKGRTITMNSMGGSAAGMMIGGAVGGLLGFWMGGPVLAYEFAQAGAAYGLSFGGLLGGTKGCMEALSRYDELDVGTVRKALTQHITASVSGMTRLVSNTLAELRGTMTTSFEKQLKLRVKELQENIAKIRENINLAKNQNMQAAAKLKDQIAQLQEQLAQFERLDEAVSSFCSGEKLQSAKAEPANESEKGAEVTYGFL